MKNVNLKKVIALSLAAAGLVVAIIGCIMSFKCSFPGTIAACGGLIAFAGGLQALDCIAESEMNNDK